MSDVENSDDERYANESFENESDNEIPEITEIESENSDNSDDEDEDALSSVKINTVSITKITEFMKVGYLNIILKTYRINHSISI